jgi:hypothetical protein
MKLHLRRTLMKRNLVIGVLVAVLFAALSAGPISAARAWGSDGCTISSVAGAFGFSYNGVGILPSGPVPVAAVGNFRQDAAGNVVGSESNSLGGNSTDQTLLGKITVNHDCSGTLVAQVYEGGVLVRTSYIHLQYENNTNEILGIFQKLVLPNGSNLPVVITIDGKRLFRQPGD